MSAVKKNVIILHIYRRENLKSYNTTVYLELLALLSAHLPVLSKLEKTNVSESSFFLSNEGLAPVGYIRKKNNFSHCTTDAKSKFRFSYDRRSVGQSVLLPSHHLALTNNSSLPRVLFSMERPL
jgi:hypothetical protein